MLYIDPVLAKQKSDEAAAALAACEAEQKTLDDAIEQKTAAAQALQDVEDCQVNLSHRTNIE